VKTFKWVLAAATVVLIVFLTATSPRKPPVYHYAPGSEVKVQGVVMNVKEFYCPVSDDQGMHLILRTVQGNVQVHLAPGRFLRSNGFRFESGEPVEVIGSRVEFQGETDLMARQVVRAQETLTFRDPDGKPLWQ
jgi:hypothetical protein